MSGVEIQEEAQDESQDEAGEFLETGLGKAIKPYWGAWTSS